MATQTPQSLVILDDEINNKKTGFKDEVREKIDKRDHLRSVEMQQKRAIREESKVTEEKSSFFTKHFQEELLDLRNMVQCQGFSSSDRHSLLEHFDAITASYQRLQKFFNDSIMFLPKFESRKAQGQLTDLLNLIEQKRSEMLPKKKFAFKSKSKISSAPKKDVIKSDIACLKEAAAQKYASKVAELKEDCELSDKNGETITMKDGEVNQKDVSLSRLNGCVIYIYGSPGTVHITDVNKCSFVIGPVSGSVFVERCDGCTIATGCQQLRVHHARETDFYLHVTSRAIIEDTTSVRFAPYNVKYPGLHGDFATAGLDKNVNNWSSVDDFNWLAMDSKSPNWSILEYEERRTEW